MLKSTARANPAPAREREAADGRAAGPAGEGVAMKRGSYVRPGAPPSPESFPDEAVLDLRHLGAGALAGNRLEHALRASMDEALRVAGISAPQYATIVGLDAHPGSTNATLARILFVTPQTMNELIQGLEAAGLVERTEKGSIGARSRSGPRPKRTAP